MISILRAFSYVPMPMPMPIYLDGIVGGMMCSAFACIFFSLCAMLVSMILYQKRGEGIDILWTIAPLLLAVLLLASSCVAALVCKAVGV